MDVAADTALGPEIMRWHLIKTEEVEKVLKPPGGAAKKKDAKDKKAAPKQKVLETTEYFQALQIKTLEMCPPDYACPFWSNDLRKVWPATPGNNQTALATPTSIVYLDCLEQKSCYSERLLCCGGEWAVFTSGLATLLSAGLVRRQRPVPLHGLQLHAA